jgi:hypothetical protein
MKYYQQVSEAMGTGINGYQKWKLAALIGIGAGFLMMFSLHILVLRFVANLIFGGALGSN